MKTFRQYLNELPDGYRELALARMNDDIMEDGNREGDVETNSASDAIWGGFTWKVKEFDFWNKVARKLSGETERFPRIPYELSKELATINFDRTMDTLSEIRENYENQGEGEIKSEVEKSAPLGINPDLYLNNIVNDASDLSKLIYSILGDSSEDGSKWVYSAENVQKLVEMANLASEMAAEVRVRLKGLERLEVLKIN